ncbi:hypothetical protein TIFTF001_007014 [Ficus carica]|uniref:Glycosyltransferase n=1 Tax=Ficus carica TaxID=3494 RepID=A0AA87ZK95_FICCA|nr:hypothetical protein TIFTF001_007014 [Ficus carica]
MGSSKTQDQLHVFFFPFMAQGHLIPAIDMAKLFASHGHTSTIITPSHYASFLSKTLEKTRFSATQIGVLTIKIPCEEVGLPRGTESLHMASTPEAQKQFFKAAGLLGPQLDELLRRHRPDCLVADMFFPWATDVAARYGIPRLIFEGTSCFAMCASLCMFLHQPYKNVSSDSEPFFIPDFPGDIEFTRSTIPDFVKGEVEMDFTNLYEAIRQAELRSYGVLVNSFYELESAYADHYTKVLGVKAWHIGPLFLYNQASDAEEKAKRGMEACIGEHECLKWLDSKEPNTVVYICFGSLISLSDSQLREIAMGLEGSGKQFIWGVNKEKKREGVREEWLPQGFEERMEGKGLIIRGWAPQVAILEHEAVGGFVTHCGWNSTLEAVCAGVAMVTWPVSAEQFYNEKLVTQVLGIGVGVGVQRWTRTEGDFVRREVVEKAVKRIMEGEEAEEMRSRARVYAELGRQAIEEGRSSYSDLNALFEDLRLLRIARDSS